MKTLYLLRHAKSDKNEPGLDDTDRQLNRRGKQDCLLMGRAIGDLNCAFEHIYCSTARRARGTLKRLRGEMPAGQFPDRAHFDDELYTFDHEQLLEWLRGRSSQVDHPLLIGHNPAIADLAGFLTGRDMDHVPTCSFIELRLKVEYWDQLRPHCGEIVRFLRPRQFRPTG